MLINYLFTSKIIAKSYYMNYKIPTADYYQVNYYLIQIQLTTITKKIFECKFDN